MIENFPVAPSNGLLTQIIPSYLYQQYQDDSDLQAFVTTFNEMAQGYMDWFNGTASQAPLGVYTSPNISGALLDWVGSGLYGIPRPAINPLSSGTVGEWDSTPWNTIPWGGLDVLPAGVPDDYYKRLMTWALYRGDGKQMSVQWLRRRVARFLYGINGGDIDIGNLPSVGITVASHAVTISVNNIPPAQYLLNFMQQKLLPVPFQLTYTVSIA